jgi:hypothetical protein
MAAKLNVLLLESEHGAARRTRDELEARGHTVVGCHEPGRAVFPCNAIADGRSCPLDTTVVDVALVVRAVESPQPTTREDGVACAIRQHVPLVVAGATRLHPYAEYAADVVEGTRRAVDACEHVAAAPLPEHSSVAGQALHETLERRGVAASPRVTVLRRHGALVVHVTDAGDLDAEAKGMGSVRMMAALRALDPDARGIDVSFADAASV